MICHSLSFNVICALVFDLKSFHFQKAALTFKGLAFPGIAGSCTDPPINLKFILLSFNLDFSERFNFVWIFLTLVIVVASSISTLRLLSTACRAFQFGREKYLTPWLLVVGRREVPLLDVTLVSV